MTSAESFDNRFDWRAAERELHCGLDFAVPHSARVWSYWLGGKDLFTADQQAIEDFDGICPEIADIAVSCEEFATRLVPRVAGAGVRQFLDIGVGLPVTAPCHMLAQQVRPDVRVVYADNDPVVLTNARVWLTADSPAHTAVINADLNDPGALLAAAADSIDFSEPVAVLLMSVLRHIPIADDDTTARQILNQLTDALTPGSYLAACDTTATNYALAEAVRLYNQCGADPWHLRSPDQLRRLLAGTGLQLLDPGLVPVPYWHPTASPFGDPVLDAWGGLAHKSRTAHD